MPRAAKCPAKWKQLELFPHPPFWLMKQIVLVRIGTLAPWVSRSIRKSSHRIAIGNSQQAFSFLDGIVARSVEGRQGTCAGAIEIAAFDNARPMVERIRKSVGFRGDERRHSTKSSKQSPALDRDGTTHPGRAFPLSARSRGVAGREPGPRQCVLL